MAQINQKGSFLKNYGFLICMIIGIVAGCIVGAVWPGATALEPIGTIFINMMFCVVVPMVFHRHVLRDRSNRRGDHVCRRKMHSSGCR